MTLLKIGTRRQRSSQFLVWLSVIAVIFPQPGMGMPTGEVPAELASRSRAERVAMAEEQAKAEFEADRYYFVTPHGRVDPTIEGLPPHAVGEHHWSLYRRSKTVSERQILLRLGRFEQAKVVRRRKLVALGMTIIGTASASYFAAGPISCQDGDRSCYAVATTFKGVAVLSSFGTILVAGRLWSRHLYTVDELFYAVQGLNDAIRDNIRAKYRLLYGIEP